MRPASTSKSQPDDDPLEYDSEDSECKDPDADFQDLLADHPDRSASPAAKENLLEYPVKSIRTSLRVYVLADKYDVVALRMLAKERFTQTAATHWTTYDDFPDVIDELFTSTISNDPLREFVGELVTRQYHDDKVRAKLKPVMNKHPELAFTVLDKMVLLIYNDEKGKGEL